MKIEFKKGYFKFKNMLFLAPTSYETATFYLHEPTNLDNQILGASFENMKLDPFKKWNISKAVYKIQNGVIVQSFAAQTKSIKSFGFFKKPALILPATLLFAPPSDEPSCVLAKLEAKFYLLFFAKRHYLCSYTFEKMPSLDEIMAQVRIKSTSYSLEFKEFYSNFKNELAIFTPFTPKIENLKKLFNIYSLSLSFKSWQMPFFKRPSFIAGIVLFLAIASGVLLENFEHKKQDLKLNLASLKQEQSMLLARQEELSLKQDDKPATKEQYEQMLGQLKRLESLSGLLESKKSANLKLIASLAQKSKAWLESVKMAQDMEIKAVANTQEALLALASLLAQSFSLSHSSFKQEDSLFKAEFKVRENAR